MNKQEKITQLVERLLQDSDMYIIDVTDSTRKKVTVYVEAVGDLNIGTITKLNRAIYNGIVEDGIYEDGEFSLDVSSPGLDMPLRDKRQYFKNKDRLVRVTTVEGVVEGRMTEVAEDHIVVEVKKKKEKEQVEIPYDDIIETKIQIEFK